MTSTLMLAAVLLTACNADPECGEGYQLLDGECVELMQPDTNDTTAYPDPDTGDTGGDLCACDVCEEGTASDPPYTSIQDAIDAAASGDEITVCPGTYRELIDLNGAISLTGAGSGQSTIDGGGDGTVLTINDDQDSGTVVSGFTLTDGDAYTGNGHGGCLLVSDADPTLLDLHIEGCTASFGGGVALMGSSSVLDGLAVLDCTAESDGGAIFIDAGAPWVVHAVFEGNYASGAAGVHAQDSAVRLENSTFFANQSALGAGAVHMADGQSVSIVNVVAALNTTGNDKEACAIEAGSNSTLYNSAAYGNEGSGLCSDGDAAYNISYGNQEEDFILGGMPGPGEGDLTDDPQFIDPNLGDFTIRDSSPMIDAGNPDSVYNDADGSRNDMGAYGGPSGSW